MDKDTKVVNFVPKELERDDRQMSEFVKLEAVVRSKSLTNQLMSVVKKSAAEKLTAETIQKLETEAVSLGTAYLTRMVLKNRKMLFDIAVKHAFAGKDWAFKWLAGFIDGSKSPSVKVTKEVVNYSDVIDEH